MTPFRIEPHFGKVGEDEFESASRNEPWHVFQEHESGFHVHDDPNKSRPEPAFVTDALLLACGTPRLAGETGSEAIHSAAPCSAIEGFKSVGNRRAIQARVFHPRHESGRRVGIPLDVTHATAVEAEPFESGAHAFAEHSDASTGFE